METIGNDLMLPCEVAGIPAPQVYWVDPQDNFITAKPLDQRVKVRVKYTVYYMLQNNLTS